MELRFAGYDGGMSSGSGSGLRFSLAGFQVAVPLNTLLGVAIIAWLWLPNFSSESTVQQWASALLFAVALLVSVLFHELAHAVAARRFGFPVLGITLWAFGGYTSYQPVRNTPGREAVIAASGPAATSVVALASWVVLQQLPDRASMLAEILAAVTLANALVAVFNMLPGLPLDGGAVLSAGVWALSGSHARGQRVAAYAGMLLAALIVALPLLLAWRAGQSADLWLLLIGVLLAAFLFVGARSALQRADAQTALEGRTALDLAVPAVVVPAWETVAAMDQFLSSQQQGRGLIALVGDADSGLRGYVLPQAVAAVPAGARAATSVASVTKSVDQWSWLPAGASAVDAVEMLQDAGLPVVLVDEVNRPIGVITSRPQG